MLFIMFFTFSSFSNTMNHNGTLSININLYICEGNFLTDFKKWPLEVVFTTNFWQLNIISNFVNWCCVPSSQFFTIYRFTIFLSSVCPSEPQVIAQFYFLSFSWVSRFSTEKLSFKFFPSTCYSTYWSVYETSFSKIF